MKTETESLIEDLQSIKKMNDQFFDRHRESLLNLLIKETDSAEESLLQEILLELNDKLERVSQLITYLESDVKREGILSRDRNGDILLDSIKIPLMQEFEIYLYQEELGRCVWTRTFIHPFAQNDLPALAGLEKGKNINGIRARLRFFVQQPQSE